MGDQWVSAGQLDGMTDAVLGQWMASGNCATLRSIDLDSSDNITEDMLGKAGHLSITTRTTIVVPSLARDQMRG